MKIYVDDIRPMPEGYDKICHTVNEVIDLIDSGIDIELISLDHDSGEYYSEGGDYIRILDYLEFKGISIPISIHSGNPQGIRNMMQIIKKNNWKYVPTEDEIFSGLCFY